MCHSYALAPGILSYASRRDCRRLLVYSTNPHEKLSPPSFVSLLLSFFLSSSSFIFTACDPSTVLYSLSNQMFSNLVLSTTLYLHPDLIMIKVTVNTLLLATTVLAGRCAVPVNGHLGDADCVGAGTIRYDHWTASGSYDRVTNMDIATGQCSTEPQSYSGGMAPLNEEVRSFRGFIVTCSPDIRLTSSIH